MYKLKIKCLIFLCRKLANEGTCIRVHGSHTTAQVQVLLLHLFMRFAASLENGEILEQRLYLICHRTHKAYHSAWHKIGNQ